MNTSKGYDQLIQEVVQGCKDVDEMSEADLNDWRNKYNIRMPHIPVGQSMRPITEDGLKALRQIGRLWFDNDPALKEILNASEAEQIAVDCLGDFILWCETTEGVDGTVDVRKELLARMRENVNGKIRKEFFYFPVRLFEQVDVEEIIVGPVVFRRPSAWLREVEHRASCALPWVQSVLFFWEGEGFRPPQGDDLADISEEHRHEVRNVLEFVGGRDWVASVEVDGRGHKKAAECANVMVLVAVETLALGLVDRRGANNLRGPSHSLDAQTFTSMSQYEGTGGLNTGVRFDVPNLGGRPGDQARYLDGIAELRMAAGNAIEAFGQVDGASSCSSLKSRWVEAMYWFSQARREATEFVSLVKYGVVLDILAKGGKEKGIVKLGCALFDKNPDDQIYGKDWSLSELVKKIYNDGRSQIAHGGKLALLNELPIQLGYADDFTRIVMLSYLRCLDMYEGADEYEAFLKDVPQIYKAILAQQAAEA